MTSNPPDASYTAGFFDGEGSVYIAKTRQGRGYCLAITIGNTDLAILEAFQRMWAGSIQRREPQGVARKPMFYWTVYADNAACFLRTVYPYLVVKRVQADLALDFQALCKDKKRHLLSSEERAMREGYYLALQAAKH